MESTYVLGIASYLASGLLGASFYYPLKKVRGWAWESYWLVYAVTALLLVPWILALRFYPDVLGVLSKAEFGTLAACFGFGAMWGVGGLTWGLGIRYLGFGLGLALACGSCAAFGTLIPPLVAGKMPELLRSTHGLVTLGGVAVSLAGIVATGLAGMSKERELSAEAKKAAVPEFNFRKGAFLAVFAGFMSAGMNFGIRAGDTLKESIPAELGLKPDVLWKGLPVLVVVLLGGFAVNFLWCVGLNARNKTAGDYVRVRFSLVPNYVLAILAGAIWYSQMLFYTVGDTKMGDFAKYSGWSVQMSSQIIFSTLLGLALGEWKGVSPRTRKRVALGLFLLIAAVFVIGFGKYLEPTPPQ